MKYMKKLLILLTIGLFTASCAKDDIKVITNAEIYSQKFEDTFGKIDPTQTWGFSNSTRSANTNGNEWGNSYVVPSAITESELNDVLTVFNEVGNESYVSLLDLDKFFVQQVYKGTATYRNHAGQTVVGSQHMDWLCTVTNKYVNVVSWWPYEEEIVTGASYDDHINNFNNGNCNDWNGIMLMEKTNSNKFGFKSSEDNGHVFYNFRMEKINGNYYVGFDFEANGQNPNEQVDRDYIYNDWIVKIVPARGYTPDDPIKEEGRIICEDLGNIGDFDFNDLVFDAIVHESGRTEITILAAGGTLDISVDGVDAGQVMGKLVNTGLTKVNTYYFESENLYDNLIDIPIIVSKTTPAGVVTSYELTAVMGKAPQKICVPRTFRWCKEYKSIKDAYPGFKDWVNNREFWNGQVNEELIYDADKI